MGVAAKHPVVVAIALWALTLGLGTGAVLGANAGLPVWLALPALIWLATLGLPTTLGVLLVASLWGRVPGLSGIGPFLGCGAAAGLGLEIIACVGVNRCWCRWHRSNS